VWKKRASPQGHCEKEPPQRRDEHLHFVPPPMLYRFRAISPLAGNEVLNDPPGDTMHRDNLTLAENRCPFAFGFRVVMQRS
jgi:hypothetical protein